MQESSQASFSDGVPGAPCQRGTLSLQCQAAPLLECLHITETITYLPRVSFPRGGQALVETVSVAPRRIPSIPSCAWHRVGVHVNPDVRE